MGTITRLTDVQPSWKYTFHLRMDKNPGTTFKIRANLLEARFRLLPAGPNPVQTGFRPAPVYQVTTQPTGWAASRPWWPWILLGCLIIIVMIGAVVMLYVLTKS